MKKIIIVFVCVFVGLFLTALITKPEKFENYDVIFNTKTLKIHKTDCEWAEKCTKNCIKTTKDQARKKGGISCNVCGG